MIIKTHKPKSKWKMNLIIISVAVCLILFGYAFELLFYPNLTMCVYQTVPGDDIRSLECSYAISILSAIGVSLLAFVYVGHEVIKWRRKPLNEYWDIL